MTQPFPPNSKVAAYLRDSGGDKQEVSVARQRDEIRHWCEANGYHLTRVFADEARSGGSTAGRDEFLAMIDYFARDVPERGVVLWMYSRFGRDFDSNQYYLSALRLRGVQVYSIEDNIPAGNTGKLVEAVTLWKDEQFREDLSRNVKSGHRRLLLQHRCMPSGTTPTGYRRVPTIIGQHRDGNDRIASRLEPDPETAPLVRRAFALRAAGKTAREVHAETHLFEVISSYYAMFRKRIYLGVYTYGDMTVNDFCEPLVAPEQWRAAQTGNPFHPRRKRSGFLLSGLLRCGECGGMMYMHRAYERYPYYRCPNRRNSKNTCQAAMIPALSIDDAVLDTVRRYILRPDVLQRANEMARDRAGGVLERMQAEADALEARLRKTAAALGRVTAAIREIGHSSALLDELRQLEQDKADLEISLAAAQADIERAQAAGPTLEFDDIRELATALVWALDNATLAERQEVLRSFIVRIDAVRDGDGVTGQVEYKIPAALGDAGTFIVGL